MFLFFEKKIIFSQVFKQLPVGFSYGASNSMFITEIENIANGSLSKSVARPELVAAAISFSKYSHLASVYRWLFTFLVAAAGVLVAIRKVRMNFLAREKLEKSFKLFLAFSAFIAVFVTF